MPTEGISISSMIAYLKEQERALSEAINALQKLEALGFGGMQAPTDFSAGATPREIQPDTFYGMSIAEAAKKYLGMSGREDSDHGRDNGGSQSRRPQCDAG